MNPKRNRTVTNTGYALSTCRDSHCPGTTISVVRFPYDRSMKNMKGTLNGVKVATDQEADALLLEYGYTRYSSRNTYRYVLSRAARRRGYTTSDWIYQSNKRRAEERMAEEC